MDFRCFIAVSITALCCFFSVLFFFFSPRRSTKSNSNPNSSPNNVKMCACCNGNCDRDGGSESKKPYMNGGTVEKVVEEAERSSTGASMMEQLVPEITTHALSYLDYPSLCRLSMTNSSMRKAANDDNAWKALYHKDFTMEQDNIVPANGWKAYYAATRAIVNLNAEFFNIIKGRSLPAMRRLWLNADYVKCVHGSGEFFTGYTDVIQSWQMLFSWGNGIIAFEVGDVRARVLSDMAWVTMKAYVDIDGGSFTITNVFEFHNGQWYMVHHHSSLVFIDGEAQQQNVLG